MAVTAAAAGTGTLTDSSEQTIYSDAGGCTAFMLCNEDASNYIQFCVPALHGPVYGKLLANSSASFRMGTNGIKAVKAKGQDGQTISINWAVQVVL